MKGNISKEFNRGFGFIEILAVLAIILFLCYKVFNLYFKKSPIDKETSKDLATQGIDTANYKTILDSSREKIQNIQKQHKKELEDIK